MERENINGYQTVHMNANDILREKRVVLGLTQQQTANRARIRLQQYQKLESGERNIMTCSFQIACRVLEALEMDITSFWHNDYVFGEEVFMSNGELCYKKTGRPTKEEPLNTNANE